ncbi:MAG: LytTR family DNA-binding domain-containing protein [Mucilaginibacter sp.]|uniref:LytR/AlgR family response regulator transcription factor n=1 Tax=Mucilaginibacter sp. TaxID=1882438 RepID=UPI0031ADE111
MLNCFVVDDEFHALETMCDYVEQTPGLKLMGSSNIPTEALAQIKNGPAPDVLITDIDMPILTGLDLAELVGEKCIVIFTSAHEDFALKAFEREGFAYLLKPVTYTKFLKVFQRLETFNITSEKTNKEDGTDALFLKGDEGKMLRVELSEIVYIESQKNYVIVVTETDSTTIYMMISEIINYLPESQFSRVHRSFIVSHRHINYITHKMIIMKNGVEIPISLSFKNSLLDKLQHQIPVSKRLSS